MYMHTHKCDVFTGLCVGQRAGIPYTLASYFTLATGPWIEQPFLPLFSLQPAFEISTGQQYHWEWLQDFASLGTPERVYPYTKYCLCNIGDKECTPTLFVPCEEEAKLVCTPTLFLLPHCLCYIGDKECRGTLFVPYIHCPESTIKQCKNVQIL